MISDRHLADSAAKITQWEILAPYLHLKEPEMVAIKKDENGFYDQQKVDCLRKWRKIYGDGASYQCLMQAALRCGQELLVSYLLSLPGIGEELQETSFQKDDSRFTSLLGSLLIWDSPFLVEILEQRQCSSGKPGDMIRWPSQSSSGVSSYNYSVAGKFL